MSSMEQSNRKPTIIRDSRYYSKNIPSGHSVDDGSENKRQVGHVLARA